MPGRSGTEVRFTLEGEVGVVDGLEVAGGAFDAERLLRTAVTEAREHVPLSEAIARTASGASA